jgi:TIP41-like family
MELLKDQSVPIIFFDEIILYEDDLHDNGLVQYSIKLRVMPACAYILARLFVRVDHVMIRVRETRLLIDFFGIQPQIYRDITWKECHWEQLNQYHLPTDVKSWTCLDSSFAQQQHPTHKIQEFQSYLQQLPDVRLPKNYYQYASFEY